MSITTYAELKTAVANWLNRDDLTSRIPEFITLGTSILNRDLRCQENEKRVTASISTEYFDLPTNFIQMRNIELDTSPRRRLRVMSPEELDTLYPSATTGKPVAYAIHGSEVQVRPAPDATYTIYLTYFYKLTVFSDDTDTNDVLTTYPAIYLYASLVAASGFIQEDDRVGTWASLYEAELKSLNKSDKQGRYSGSVLVSRTDTGNP